MVEANHALSNSAQVYNCSCWCVGAVSDDVIFDLQVQVCGIASINVIFVSHLYTWRN